MVKMICEKLGESRLHAMQRWRCVVGVLACVVSLSACMHKAEPPPVVDAWHQGKGVNTLYRVQRGDTLYSVAWAYGLDGQHLAEINRLSAPYVIHPGDSLRLHASSKLPVRPSASKAHVSQPPSARVTATHTRKPSSTVKAAQSHHAVHHWIWPVKGQVVHGFNAKAKRKGIDIAGALGHPVRSAAPGVVVYSGSGLRGYGRLLIVKHDAVFLSAYAYNQQLLVKEGDHVKTGQVIAKMGPEKPGGPPMLHFQIRKRGQPVNPLTYLKA